jgi:antirestriction protein
MCMNNSRVSKTVEEYKTKLLAFFKRLEKIADVDVHLSEHKYASFIYAKGNNSAVEVMEADSGVWVEFFEIDNDEPKKEASYYHIMKLMPPFSRG